MSYLRDLMRAEKSRAAQYDRERKARTSYGVFQWRGDNRYTLDAAEFVYKHRGAAERKARALGDPYVVREILSVVKGETA